MKVELVIDGKRHAGQPEGQHVVVDGASCPTCGTLDGVVDSTGHVVALAASSAGMRTAMRDNPGCKPQAAHEAGPLRVFSDEHIRHERTIEGRAICKRCRHVVGTLVVTTKTFFGHTEDDAAQARGRVY